MASPAASGDSPNAPREQEPLEQHHPEPVCREAQKWIEAVTGKSFGDKDFRSALENGILLCELLSAIKPGLVKKINRLPTPIAGLDNLSVFLRGCEELGLKGAQLFDPGDLQDTSIRANLKDSDCNRKLKNVLNTVYWLGKAASGCASFSGPTLNLKEFEGLLAQMKLESEEGGDSSQKRSVRDSGYDCWDSERSESLSPPRHTRDNSLDSLDSFGSRSQHSPSPDVVNRGNSDGRGSDSEADAPNRKPDVRKDDMLARRTSSKEARSSVPFNQFLPNRTNATSYVPTPWRKPHTEEREQRRSVSMGDMLNEEEVGHLPSLSQSRHEHMHEQYNNFLEDEDHWQDDLARWKNRRRSASQDLIRKEEERKRIEKRMKGEGRDGNKRKSIKTYKEIVEEKERREAELCEAYRNAATPEEAALVLQRYALRFTISDAVLDSLKLPRSTSTPKNELNELDKEQKPESPVNNSEMSEPLRQPESPVNNTEMSEPLRQPESHVVTNQEHMKPEEIETDTAYQQEKLATSPLTPNSPTSPLSTVTDSQSVSPQSLEFNEPQTQRMESPTAQQAAITGNPQPQTKHTSPQSGQGQPHPTQSANALPSPPSVSTRPIPLLAAKPYCQPGAVLPGHKPIKDGLVRVNGEATEELTVSTPPTSPQHSPQETKDVLSKEAEKDAPPVEAVKSAETAEQQPTETEKSTPSSGSAISSLIEGRNCIITTTIVTELTQKVVEPLHTDTQNDGEVETTGLFEKPEDEKNTQPSSTPSSLEEYSPTVSEGLEESSVTEQYQREQEKLMKEWEKAQLEVEEEERKHNEEERRILEETVTPLNPTGLLNQVSGQTATTSPGPENDNTEGKNVPLQHNGQKISTGNEDQHASKLHFFQDSGADVEPSKKQELWKTASLDRNTQLNQGQVVKRSGSHDVVTSEQQSSSPKPQPPSPSRCVSGKRLCTGCSQPLGKGAAMIIDTLGLFFHIHCFKCGLCGVQLGDATAGTDVRIRKGMLSCHECYIASRGRGQPTTL
ncbi:LIM and calponin homology domains-containing protein 1-like isoform X2 [Pelmatolapia mariae]|uniref:LIM and calponin homology domains-containing protein 1-like isoform X2 n=1 Tax=Pelmatolapia mariae TaxID=158779 RepID=UPI002FE6065D